MNQISVMLIAVLCAALSPPALAYHPLLTEDTETLGAGVIQIEASVDASRGRPGAVTPRTSQYNLVVSYGLSKTLDLQIGAPRLRRHTDDGTGGLSVARGAGDASIDLKWLYYEAGGFTLGLKPGLTLARGDANRGLGQGRSNYGAILMAGYETGPLELYGHLGARRNRNTLGERGSLYQASVAALYETVERLWLTAEAGVLRQPDPALRRNPAFFGIGVIWGPTKDVDLDVGWRRTRNDASVERTLGLGVTVRW